MVELHVWGGSEHEAKYSADPKYEDEVSGCTASVAIVSKTHIYVVRLSY